VGKEGKGCFEVDTRTAKSQLRKLLKLVEKSGAPVRKIVVFGSHAKGLATKISDLDVCLIFADDVATGPDITAKIRYQLGRLNLNIDLSSLYLSELRLNKLSCFVNEIKKTSISAEDFLTRAPKNLDAGSKSA
jgi:predicted nucleotidyltransferase